MTLDLSINGVPCTCDAVERFEATLKEMQEAAGKAEGALWGSMGPDHRNDCALMVYWRTIRRVQQRQHPPMIPPQEYRDEPKRMGIITRWLDRWQ